MTQDLVTYNEMLLDGLASKFLEAMLKHNPSWVEHFDKEFAAELCYIHALGMFETGMKYKAKICLPSQQ